MKVLFINKFLDKEAIYRDPLGIMTLAAMIRPKHKIFIIEPIRENIQKRMEEIQPDVIAYSLRTGYHRYYIDLNLRLKKKYKFISIFGGPHVTFYPNVIHEEGVDTICHGEADEAFAEFIDILEQDGDITKVKNFWVKTPTGIIKNEKRPLNPNLDSIPFPDREIFDDYEEVRIAKVHSFIASRGCPFKCTYCFNDGMSKSYEGQKYVRRRSVDNVIEELKIVKEKYDLKIAIFEDDTFNLSRKWLKEFCEKFSKLNLKLLPIGVRAELIDEEQVQWLKQANCVSLIFGLESGNERIRREVLFRNITDEKMIECSRLLRKHGIGFATENILAIPTSTLDHDIETLALNLKCKPLYGGAKLMQPYPGTMIYNIAVRMGLFKEKNFDVLTDFTASSNLKMDNRRERENLQRLFAIVIRFPFLFRYIKFLIKLRLKPLYAVLHEIFKAYIGIKFMPYRRSLREYYVVFRRFIFSRESTIFFQTDGRNQNAIYGSSSSTKETPAPIKEAPVLLEDSPIIPKKYTVPLKKSQIANNVTATVFDSGER